MFLAFHNPCTFIQTWVNTPATLRFVDPNLFFPNPTLPLCGERVMAPGLTMLALEYCTDFSPFQKQP